MTSLPTTHDAPRSIHPATLSGGKPADGRLHAVLADSNLFIIAALCMIGLLVTLNAIFGFPSFGSSIDEIAQFLG